MGYGKFLASLKIDKGQFSNPGEFYLPLSYIQRYCLRKAQISRTERALREMDKKVTIQIEIKKTSKQSTAKIRASPCCKDLRKNWAYEDDTVSTSNFLIPSKRQI